MPVEELNCDDAIAMSDEELEQRLHDCWIELSELEVAATPDLEGHETIGYRMQLFVDEIIERYAPHIALLALEHGPVEFREEDIEWLRQREAATLIRSALEGESDDA
jgi:hypothetical protein